MNHCRPLAFLLLGCLLQAQTKPVASPNPSHKLVFEDDFKGKEVDEKKWSFGGKGVQIIDKQLSLEVVPTETSMLWLGSQLTSVQKFDPKGGYIEASIKFVKTLEHGCYFSVKNSEGGQRGDLEMNYFMLGGETVILTKVTVGEKLGPPPGPKENLSYLDSPPARLLRPKVDPIPPSPTYAAKFHRYGFYWAGNDYRYYVDGRLVFSMKQPPVINPVYIHLGHNLLPENGLLKNFPDPTKPPEPMRVEWVKVFQ
jgi:beta-glucanase (GH16 family)